MKRLVTIPNEALAKFVLWALNDADIRADLTMEHGLFGLYSGLQESIIWIADDEDTDAAMRIYHDVLAARTVDRCPKCGYDLQGHIGRVNCPECGATITAPEEDQTCSKCSESVPASFDVCWNCGCVMRDDGAE